MGQAELNEFLAVKREPASPSRRRFRGWLVAFALAAVTLACFWPARSGGLVNLDDDAYVLLPMVSKGLRSAAVVWALTSIHTANWHPLTSLSHMLDVTLFGLNPGPMHWENILLHIINSLLVLGVWRVVTGAFWRPVLVAALFALHPLHVESVAWISERKDVASTLFWLLGLLAYYHWTQRPSWRRYALILGALIVALLFKPMAVTFPFTLLLLDVWPLRRWPTRSLLSLLREKLLLFGVVVVHGIITIMVQWAGGAAHYAERIPLSARLGNAAISYLRYLGKTVWPESLSPIYYHPGHWPIAYVLVSVVGLGSVSWLAWQQRVHRPWLAFGWLWYVGTLLPVIGIIQVGAQAMADRYTYVPLLGIFTVVVWGSAEVVTRWRSMRRSAIVAAVFALAAAGTLTFQQGTVWHDSVSLYRHSIAVGEDNPAVRYLLGATFLSGAGTEEQAVAEFKRAIALEPTYINAHTQLAAIALHHGHLDEARQIMEQNIRNDPKNPGLHYNLAVLDQIEGRPEAAWAEFHETLRLDPRASGARREIAQVYASSGRLQEARAQYEIIARNSPWDSNLLTEYGVLLANLGDLDQSQRVLARAIWIDPDNRVARTNLATVEKLAAKRP